MKRCKHIIYSILVPLVMVGLVSLIAYLVCGAVFTSNDCYEQYLPFFGAYYDVLTEGKSIFYSLSGSMGFDFWAVFVYYLASPLNLVIALFDKKDIIYVVNALIIFKISLCGGSFAAFIKGRFPNASLGKIVLFSTIYAVSGYTIGYMWNVMWLDSLAIFPLVIMGLDILMKEKSHNWYMYTGFLALSIICCYMMGYMICIFIFLYFFTYEFKSFKDFLMKFIKVGAASILAICLSGIFIIPAYEALNSSIVSTESMPPFEFYGSFVECFKTMLIGYPQHGVSFVQENANLFITVFGALMVVVYFAASGIRISEKIRNAGLLLVLILSFNLKPLNYLWHGMHEQNGIPNRFSFMVIFIMLIMGFTAVIQKKSSINKKTLFIGWSVFAGLMAVMAVLDTTIIINVVLTVLLSLGYVLILSFAKTGIRFNAIRVMALVEIVITLSVGIFCSNGAISGDYGYYVEDFDTINATKEEGFYREKIDAVYNEKEFYYENVMCYMTPDEFEMNTVKQFVTHTKNIGHMSVINEGTYYGINSMGLFNSFHHYSLSDYYNKTGGAGGPNNSVYYGDNLFMDMLLGVKYYYVTSTYCNSTGYEYVKKEGEVDIYRNSYALSVGYVIPEGFLTAELTSNPFTSMNNISRSITGEECFFHVGFTYAGDCRYEYEVLVAGELLVQPDNGFIKRIIIKVDDEIVYIGSCPEVVVSVGEVQKGQKVVIEADYSKDTYVDPSITKIYAATMKKQPFERLYNKLSKNQMDVIEYSDDYLKGKINLEEDAKVMITVPYDKGFSVTVDGKDAEYELYENLFYVFKLSKGEHEIDFSYRTPGWDVGLRVSLSALGVYIIAVVITVVLSAKTKKAQ